jgi:hypothetical protein
MDKIKNNEFNAEKDLNEFEEDLVQPKKEEPKVETNNDKEEKK